MNYLCLLFICLLSALQVKADIPLKDLVSQTQALFNVHNTLQPIFYSSKICPDDLNLSTEDKAELNVWVQKQENDLQGYQDSLAPGVVIEFLNEKLSDKLDAIIRHSQFFDYNVLEVLNVEYLDIVTSDDHRLVSFSFDEKTGGTYRSRIAKCYYVDQYTGEIKDISQEQFVWSDGYKKISILPAENGVKYVLEGDVRTCNLCFASFVQVINEDLEEEFIYSVTNRDWNDGVKYVPETQSIEVRYHTDDLTPYCACEEAKTNAEPEKSLSCTCIFRFNGNTFELETESVQ